MKSLIIAFFIFIVGIGFAQYGLSEAATKFGISSDNGLLVPPVNNTTYNPAVNRVQDNAPENSAY